MTLPIVLIILQWLHILGGISWFGSYVFLDFVMWPVIWRLPASKAKVVQEAIYARCVPVYGVIGPLVVLLGFVRGTIFGPVQSFQFVFSTLYGGTWLVALLLGITLLFWGALWHSHGAGPIWEGERVSSNAIRRLRVGFVFEMCSFSAILVCMVLMHFGY